MSTQDVVEYKNKGGRPKKYTEEFVENEAIELEKWIEGEDNIFIEDFCFERGYHESRISELVKLSDRFSQALDMLKMKQKTNLFKGGLKRNYSHQMCALILGHNHNIVAKTEQKITGSVADPLSFVLGQIADSKPGLINDETIHSTAIEHSAGVNEKPVLALESSIQDS